MRDQRSARFGIKWWDRHSHYSQDVGGEVITTGSDDAGRLLRWPRPCPTCVRLNADEPIDRRWYIIGSCRATRPNGR